MTHLNVAVRIRPLSERETEAKAVAVVEVVNSNVIAVTNLKVLEQNAGDSRERVRRFSFDYCFDETSTQEQVFEAVENVIGNAVKKRYHTCVLAYGQSSSGKTHTIMGMEADPGLTPRLCERVFDYISEEEEEKEEAKAITVSYLEIYNEKVKDLLSRDEHQNTLRVREHPSRGTYVQGLTHRAVSDSNDLLNWLQIGNKKRRVSATSVNNRSSRSHSVFTITCFGGVKLTLVDLAGSERTGSRSFNNTSTFREGANINKSLVALGNVIFALADQSKSPRRRYVPYRDSVLTWLLKDTLGGNSKTVMIATISPSQTCYNETVNTLRFGHRAKQIIAQPVSNEDPKQKTIRDLKVEVTRLKDLLLKVEIDPHLRLACDQTRTTTVDRSTNTEDSILDENLELTRKILDGLLEQIKTKLRDDFRWCKEELLRTSGSEGVFGEIIKNNFGKKLVCKEYSTNITQIYNVPEFKVFVYSDGKNLASIEGVEQKSQNNLGVIPLSIREGNRIERGTTNAVSSNQDVTSNQLVDENLSQGISIPIIEGDTSEDLVSRGTTCHGAQLVDQSAIKVEPQGIPKRCNIERGSGPCANAQLVNEGTIKLNRNPPHGIPNIDSFSKGVTNTESVSNGNLVHSKTKKGGAFAIPVEQGVTAIQLVDANVINVAQNSCLGVPDIQSSIEDLPNTGALNTNIDSVVLVNQGTSSAQLVDDNDIKVNLRGITDVDSSRKGIPNPVRVSEGLTDIDLSVSVNQDTTSTQLVDDNVVKVTSSADSPRLGVSNNTGTVSEVVTDIDLSVLVKQDTTSTQLVDDNVVKDTSSADSPILVVSNTGTVSEGVTNTDLVDKLGTTVNPSAPNTESVGQVIQGTITSQLFDRNVIKVDCSDPPGVPSTRPISEGVTNIDLSSQSGVAVNQGTISIQSFNESVVEVDPDIDSLEETVYNTGPVSEGVVNTDFAGQSNTKVKPATSIIKVAPRCGPHVESPKKWVPNTEPVNESDTNTKFGTQINQGTPNTPRHIPNVDSLKKGIPNTEPISEGVTNFNLADQLGVSINQGITDIDSPEEGTSSEGTANFDLVGESINRVNQGTTTINLSVPNIQSVDENVVKVDPNDLRGIPNTTSLREGVTKIDLACTPHIQLVDENIIRGVLRSIRDVGSPEKGVSNTGPISEGVTNIDSVDQSGTAVNPDIAGIQSVVESVIKVDSQSIFAEEGVPNIESVNGGVANINSIGQSVNPSVPSTIIKVYAPEKGVSNTGAVGEGVTNTELVDQRDTTVNLSGPSIHLVNENVVPPKKGVSNTELNNEGIPNIDLVSQSGSTINPGAPSNVIEVDSPKKGVSNSGSVYEVLTNVDLIDQRGTAVHLSGSNNQLIAETVVSLEKGVSNTELNYEDVTNIDLVSHSGSAVNPGAPSKAIEVDSPKKGVSNSGSVYEVLTNVDLIDQRGTAVHLSDPNIQLIDETVVSFEKGVSNTELNNEDVSNIDLVSHSGSAVNPGAPSKAIEVNSPKKGVSNSGSVYEVLTNVDLIDQRGTAVHLSGPNIQLIDETVASLEKGVSNTELNNEDVSNIDLVSHSGGTANPGAPSKDIEVNSPKKGVSNSGPVYEGLTNTDLIDQRDTAVRLSDRRTQLVDENVVSPKKGVSNSGSVNEGVTNTDLVNRRDTTVHLSDPRIQSVDENVHSLSVSSKKGVSNSESVNEGVTNADLRDLRDTIVHLSDPSIQLVDENVDSLSVSPKKGVSNSGSVNEGVTNTDLVDQCDTAVHLSNPRIQLVDENVDSLSVSSPNIEFISEGVPSIDLVGQSGSTGAPSNVLPKKGVSNLRLVTKATDLAVQNSVAVNQGTTSTQSVDWNNPSIDTVVSESGTNSQIVNRITPKGSQVLEVAVPIIESFANRPPVGPKVNTAARKFDLKVLRAATARLIPVMDVSSAAAEKPVVKLRRTFSVCSADMESKKSKMYGSYETLSKYQQPEPQLRKSSLDKSSSSVRNLGKEKASTESVPDVTKAFSKVEAKVDSIRKATTKPRAEIVAAVTQRLYAKIKKKEVATETDDIIREHKGTLARIRLQDITQRALRACRRRHAESQTEMCPIRRVKETATDVQDLKIEATEMKHVSTQEVITTKDAAVSPGQDTFDASSRQSLILTKSCGVQVNSASPPPSTIPKDDQQHLLSFTKYLRAHREPKIEVATSNPIYTSSVNINVSHNYINRTDSLSGDSLEDQANTVSLPTPDLISNHNSLETEKANQATCLVKEERCRSLPTYQHPKMYKLRVTETKPHETSLTIEQPAILKSIVKQNNDQDQSDCASDCSEGSPPRRAFENVPDSLNYHFNKSVRFDEEPVSERILEVMTNFLKEATNLMTNLAAAATNKFDAEHAYDLQVTVTDAANVINRKARRRPRRRKPRKNEAGSQTCTSYEHAISQTSPKRTSEKSVETYDEGEVPDNKYECLVKRACDRLERCAEAISTDWYGPAQPEDSSMESNVTFSDYGSLPRQKLKHRPGCSPRAFLKELTSMRKQIIDSSREELVGENHQNCG